MKRSESLAPLSREHHSALILAQLLKKNAPLYKGLPADIPGKIAYAKKMFHESLKEHFSQEELIITKVQHCHKDIEETGSEIILEHIQLVKKFNDLDNATDPETFLDDLGNALDNHIRKEERVLFPLIEQYCSEDELTEIGNMFKSNSLISKKDIETTKDIELLVNTFYEKVKANHIIGYIFNEIANVNWEEHLPVMYRFWDNVIFFSGSYTGNPLIAHKHLNKLFPLTTEHFKEWNRLFVQTVNELFQGEKANLAMQRALSISTVMQLELHKSKI